MEAPARTIIKYQEKRSKDCLPISFEELHSTTYSHSKILKKNKKKKKKKKKLPMPNSAPDHIQVLNQ
jgi:hypothetical protein